MNCGYPRVNTAQQHIDRQSEEVIKISLMKNKYRPIRNREKILTARAIINFVKN